MAAKTELTKTTEPDNIGLDWIFCGRALNDDDLKGAAGFVYLITERATGRKYLGRKYFRSVRMPRRKGATRRVGRDSGWRDYYGSSDALAALIAEKGRAAFDREIVSIHKTRGDTNYAEVRELFVRDVLEREDYINDNINGKWFSKPAHIKAGRHLAPCSSWWTPKQDPHR